MKRVPPNTTTRIGRHRRGIHPTEREGGGTLLGSALMDIGVAEAFGASPSRDLAYLQEFARRAEEVGFDSLWMPEHIVFFDTYGSRYPYNESGTLVLGDQPGLYDPFA